MTDRATTQSALLQCFDEIDALARSLDGDQWTVQSLCPEWDVRGCMTHVVGVEDLLIGWRPAAADDPPPFDKLADFANETAGLDAGSFVTRVAQTHEQRRDELASLTDAEWTQPCMTPVGAADYGRFMNVRVFDYWVHQRDIAMPLGIATDDSGPAAEIALNEVHGSLGYIVGKKIGLPDGASITFELNGGVDRRMHVAVDGRAAVVDDLERPSVIVTADATTFIMLACGRIDPAEQIEAGRIRWTGDDEWGRRAAENLRFTM